MKDKQTCNGWWQMYVQLLIKDSMASLANWCVPLQCSAKPTLTSYDFQKPLQHDK